MSNRIVETSDKKLDKLITGINKLSNIVKITLGPKGKNVIIKRKVNEPHATKDGVTVANEVVLRDEIEDLAVHVVRQATSKTAKVAGDGTSTSTVLAQSFINSLYQCGDKHKLTELFDYLYNEVCNEIDKVRINIQDEPELLKSVATVSANNDAVVGNMVSEAYEKSSVVHVQLSKGNESYVKRTEGASFGNGYLSPYFVTNEETGECEFSECLILFYDGMINTAQQIGPIINSAMERKHPILIIANEIKDDALQAMVTNKVKNNLPIACVKAPYFANERIQSLKDLATLTGGELISSSKGLSLDDVDLNMLGQCNKVIITKDDTKIIEGAGERQVIDSRIEALQKELENTENSPLRLKNLKKRLATFSEGISTIYVGGNTEIEMRHRKDRVDDAVSAARVALKEGVVGGGGVVLYKIATFLQKRIKEGFYENVDENFYTALECLKTPFFTILENANYDVDEVRKYVGSNGITNNPHHGINLVNNEYGYLIEMGIVDPVAVIQSALKNALSVSEVILNTGGIISVTKENMGDSTNEINPFNPEQFAQ